MAKKFKNFYIDHASCEQNALASLAASLALSARVMEKVLVYSRDLYYCKFALEDSKTPKIDLQVKEVLETLTSLESKYWGFPYIDFVLYGILPDDPKEAAAIRSKAPRFYYNAIIQTLYR